MSAYLRTPFGDAYTALTLGSRYPECQRRSADGIEWKSALTGQRTQWDWETMDLACHRLRQHRSETKFALCVVCENQAGEHCERCLEGSRFVLEGAV